MDVFKSNFTSNYFNLAENDLQSLYTIIVEGQNTKINNALFLFISACVYCVLFLQVHIRPQQVFQK